MSLIHDYRCLVDYPPAAARDMRNTRPEPVWDATRELELSRPQTRARPTATPSAAARGRHGPPGAATTKPPTQAAAPTPCTR
jgi:hypothetical protein